ncbi:MAG: GNAT family N-acetyltransferase [Desulfurococcales archaeon]|nr:GNAT family N-acetyltransferase [Desulfurococcales archaeon]
MASIIVRKAGEEDVKVLAEYVARLKSLNEELDPHYKVVDDLESVSLEYVSNAISNPDSIVLVAVDEDSGSVIGFIKVDVKNRIFYEPKYKGVITDLYVHPSYRRKRVGGLLIEKAVEELGSRGVNMITAVYPVNNLIAREFYGKLGFTDLDIEQYRTF